MTRGGGNSRGGPLGGEIGAAHSGAGSLAQGLEGKVACAGPEVEQTGAAPQARAADHLSAPAEVPTECHQAVHQVVSSCDPGEHPLDAATLAGGTAERNHGPRT